MADEKDIAAEEPSGGRKRLLIITVLAVLLLLLGAGAAAFVLLGSDQGHAEGETAEPVVEEGDPVYHRLDPVFVVSLPPGGPAGMMQIAIEVMTRTPGVIETLQANDPMVRHHLLNLLEAQQADELLTAQGKQALQDAIHELLSSKLRELGEPGEIRGVFFTQFVLQ